MLDDIKRSGLTKKDAAKMQLQTLNDQETKRLTKKYLLEAYRIPYFRLDGKVDGSFFRLKFLEDAACKYWQPQRSLPRFYLPPFVGWQLIAKNTSETLYITEGEKKAAKAAREGLPTIGLGGVWAWRSKKSALASLPDFDIFQWQNRKVVLVFDSDLMSNPQVLGALNALASLLINLGAAPCYVQLPQPDVDKVGFDDYLVKHGADKFVALPEKQFDESAKLFGLNDNFALITDLDRVLQFDGHVLHKPVAFVKSLLGNNFVIKIGADGTAQQIPTGGLWMAWQCRREYRKLTYDPSCIAHPITHYNLWPGWGSTAKSGNIKPWHALLRYIFGGDKKALSWFVQWCAYPIQNPGAKMYTACMLHGIMQGTGKSLLGMTLGKIYGKNFAVINRESLFSTFTPWAVNRQFVLAEEITGVDRRQLTDHLKYILTRSDIDINTKYIPNYTLPDTINYLFTSQHCDALFIEAADRRFFVWEMPAHKLSNGFYASYDKWYKSTAGIAALHDYLLHVDLSKFNPLATAYGTAAKATMIDLSASDLDVWCRKLHVQPCQAMVHVGGRATGDLYTTAQLTAIYNLLNQNGAPTSGIAVAKALRRAGFFAPRAVRCGTEVNCLIAVINRERWDKKDTSQWGQYYVGKKGAILQIVPK